MFFACREPCGIAAMVWRASFALVMVSALMACQREKRDLHPPAVGPADPNPALQITPLHAGGPPSAPPNQTPFADENNAYALAQGKQFYNDFNCSTCHAQGGGDIGPPLKDELWIYGSAPSQIYASIMEGRPRGMPAFRQRLTEEQAWQLVAYVRSLGGLAPSALAPGRDDHMQAFPENTNPKNKPVDSHPR